MLLPIQYEKFSDAANMGLIGEACLTGLQSSYTEVVHGAAEKSPKQALHEDMAYACAESNEEKTDIDVFMDARHCWQKIPFMDIVCLGDRTHKAIRVVTISKEEEPISLKHKLHGVQKIYEYLDNQQCPVDIHAHDSGTSSVQLSLMSVCRVWHTVGSGHSPQRERRGQRHEDHTGPRRREGRNWYPQVADKAASVKTAVYYQVKKCKGKKQSSSETGSPT